MTTPDVTVVMAVYNTMPYLTRSLRSLAAQTIGADRMQVIAVDDGSTDRSGRVLDRFAAGRPGWLVVHQANSGGPARPFNRGLDLADGRYVFFLGADDWLAPDALRRMVEAADGWDSDVLLGKVAGVNSRHIYQDIFAETTAAIDLSDGRLARSLANTKLFRRDRLDQHDIRYDERLPIGSDLPFTLAACYHAKRVSVLADYECYFAVRRARATNITYRSEPRQRLNVVMSNVEFAAELIPAGPMRDAVLARRFDHEVARLLEDDFRQHDRPTQEAIHAGVGELARRHLSAAIMAELGAETRIRLALAADGAVDDLIAVIRQDAEVGVPATVVEGGRRFAAYPGFRTGRAPDAAYDVTDSPDWLAKLDVRGAEWSRGDLVLTVAGPGVATEAAPAGGASAGAVSVGAEEAPGAVSDSGDGVRHVRLSVEALLRATPSTGRRFVVSAQPGPYQPNRALGAVTATGAAGAAAVRAPAGLRLRPVVRRHGRWLVAVQATVDPSGRLMIAVVPMTARRALPRLRRFLRMR